AGSKIVLHLSGAPEAAEITCRSTPARKARSTYAGGVARSASHRGNSGRLGSQRPAGDNRQARPRGEEGGRIRKSEYRSQNSESGARLGKSVASRDYRQFK